MKQLQDINQKENWDLWIHYYFDCILSEDQEIIFDQKCQTDKEFDALVDKVRKSEIFIAELEYNAIEQTLKKAMQEKETQENQKKNTPLTPEVSLSVPLPALHAKPKISWFAIAAVVTLLAVVGTGMWIAFDRKTEKGKEKEFVKKENQKPPIVDIIIRKPQNDNIENPPKKEQLAKEEIKKQETKQEPQEIQKQEEVYAGNFEPNAGLDVIMGNSKSASKFISVSSPKNDDNFTSKIKFDFLDNDNKEKLDLAYKLQIINNDEISILTKNFNANEMPFEVDFSAQKKGLYYWRLYKNQNLVHVGRFTFKK